MSSVRPSPLILLVDSYRPHLELETDILVGGNLQVFDAEGTEGVEEELQRIDYALPLSYPPPEVVAVIDSRIDAEGNGESSTYISLVLRLLLERPDWPILILLSGISDKEVLEKVRERSSNVKIASLSFLARPFSGNELVAAVRATLS